MINLKQISAALESMNIDTIHIGNAADQLHSLLSELDEVEVKGRQNVDTLLGCMMAIDAILGEDDNG